MIQKFTSLLCLAFLVLTGCQQDEGIIDSSLNSTVEDSYNKNFNSSKDPLLPTGNSTLDTENLQAAINDSNLDDGGTLFLGPGTFLVHASLVRQAYYPLSDGYNSVPFKGTIQGSGKGVTIIKSVRGPGGEDFVEWKDPDFEFTPATLIIDGGEYVSVRDMNFEADSEIIDAWFYGSYNGQDYFLTGMQNYILLGGHNGDSHIDNVYFNGSLDSKGLPEIAHLFQIWVGTGGTHTFKSSELENGVFDILNYNHMSNATINIGGNGSEKVTIKNLLVNHISAGAQFQFVDCNINLSNIMTNDSGIWLQIWPANTLSNTSITNSDIKQIPNSAYAGIETWVWGGDVFSEISNNKIYSEDSFLWGPIFSEGVTKSLITNNKITGRGPAAIYLSVLNWPSGNAMMKANNLSTWENTGVNPWGFTAAPIWLGPFITDSFVVGGNNKINVFDEPAYDTNWNPLYDINGNPLTIPGYDNLNPPSELINLVPKNNIFTGVNNMHMNIGQDVKDAMKQKAEAKKAMMKNKRIR